MKKRYKIVLICVYCFTFLLACQNRELTEVKFDYLKSRNLKLNGLIADAQINCKDITDESITEGAEQKIYQCKEDLDNDSVVKEVIITTTDKYITRINIEFLSSNPIKIMKVKNELINNYQFLAVESSNATLNPLQFTNNKFQITVLETDKSNLKSLMVMISLINK